MADKVAFVTGTGSGIGRATGEATLSRYGPAIPVDGAWTSQ